ncbi:MAG TPA: DUF2231 domain-containing protein [Candidatus Methylomirabilis sp.]|nr:DUF2231 domain-containing protein [Candidatus Methylomirabilis sp.]
MPTPASIRSHPIHPMIVGFPISLWIASFVADLIFVLGWGGPMWKRMAFYLVGAGILGAVAAAVPGYIDYRTITVKRVGRIGQRHMIFNLVSLGLFALSLALRFVDLLGILPVVVSAAGVAVLAVAGWLGGELVFVHGMGVEAAE